MGHDASSASDDLNLIYVLGLLAGGLLIGSGVVSLWYSFGIEQGNMADHLSVLGASGLDNLTNLPASNISIGLILTGALVMVFLNAGGWRRTGGY